VSRPTYGLFLVTGSALMAEAAAYTGVDWAVIDMEAAPMTKVDALHQAQALTGTNVVCLIRVQCLDRHAIEHALDLGVDGIVVPKVESAHDAELAARFSHYPPEGARGVNPIRASAYYYNSEGYFSDANNGVLCIVQIESRVAVSNAIEIAKTPGIDMLFIGAGDLASDLGHPGDPTGPDFDEARLEVLTAAEKAGKPAGIFAYSTKLARQYTKEGFRFIAVGNEVKFFTQSAAMTLATVRR